MAVVKNSLSKTTYAKYKALSKEIKNPTMDIKRKGAIEKEVKPSIDKAIRADFENVVFPNFL